MHKYKVVIFSLCAAVFILCLVNEAMPACDPVCQAWLERDQEEAAYQNAIRWEDLEHCGFCTH